MFLLGCPLEASAARFGRFVSIALSFPFPFPLISISLQTCEEQRESPTLHLQRQAQSWWRGDGGSRFTFPLCLPEGKTPHGYRHCVGAGEHAG